MAALRAVAFGRGHPLRVRQVAVDQLRTHVAHHAAWNAPQSGRVGTWRDHTVVCCRQGLGTLGRSPLPGTFAIEDRVRQDSGEQRSDGRPDEQVDDGRAHLDREVLPACER